jgi:hypothetical protein
MIFSCVGLRSIKVNKTYCYNVFLQSKQIPKKSSLCISIPKPVSSAISLKTKKPGSPRTGLLHLLRRLYQTKVLSRNARVNLSLSSGVISPGSLSMAKSMALSINSALNSFLACKKWVPILRFASSNIILL